jgi:DNA-binding response OmpR family regulator
VPPVLSEASLNHSKIGGVIGGGVGVSAWQAGRVRVLVVEDEQRLAVALRRGLQAEGFAVDIAADGPTGLDLARHGSYDAVILDVMLPGMSGYRVVRALRAAANWVPVLMLSAKDGEYDQADGLDVGADDYLTKPFSYVVLLARLRALLRRGAPQRPAVLVAGDLSLDPARRRVTCAGVEVALTSREFSLLEYLIRRQGEVVSKIELLDHVWDAAVQTAPNAVEVYVGYLRRKLGRDRLLTVRGAGYRLVAVPASEQGAPDQAGAGIGAPSSARSSP